MTPADVMKTYKYKSGKTPYEIIAREYADKTIDATFASFSDERRKAVKAFYESGYITDKEVDELMYNDFVERNECTYLNMYSVDSLNINLSCYEIAEPNNELLFAISYNGYCNNVTQMG